MCVLMRAEVVDGSRTLQSVAHHVAFADSLAGLLGLQEVVIAHPRLPVCGGAICSDNGVVAAVLIRILLAHQPSQSI